MHAKFVRSRNWEERGPKADLQLQEQRLRLRI